MKLSSKLELKTIPLSISLILLGVLNTGCNETDSDRADYNEYLDYSDDTNNDEYIVNVSTGGPVYNAFVVDVDDKVAEKLDDNSNQYKFIGHIRYPLRAYGGYVDINHDGSIDENDISNHIMLRTNEDNNLTMLTTFKSAEPDTTDDDADRVVTKENASSSDIEDSFDIPEAEQKKLPSANLKIAAFSNAIFKIAQGNLYTIGTELNNIDINDTILHDDYDDKVDLYTQWQRQGKTLEEINEDGIKKLYEEDSNGETEVDNIYIHSPTELVDLSNETMNNQPDFVINGNGLTDVKVIDDSIYYSIPYVLFLYGLIQQTEDTLERAYNVLEDPDGNPYLAYADPNESDDNDDDEDMSRYWLDKAKNSLTNLLLDKFDIYQYENEEFTLPSKDTSDREYKISANDDTGKRLEQYLRDFRAAQMDRLDRATNGEDDDGEDDQDDKVTFSIEIARHEYQETLSFARQLINLYNPNLQYLFRNVYNNIRKSRDILIEVAHDIDNE